MAFKMKYSGGGFPYKSAFKQNVEEKAILNKEAPEYVPDPDDFIANLPKKPGPTVENEPGIIKEDITKYDESGRAILNKPAIVREK